MDRVKGFIRGTARERDYQPFELFHQATPDEPTYHTITAPSAVRPEPDVYLSVAYPRGDALPEAETLSIGLTCTNGSLPEGLRIGDICESTGSSPEFATYRNITPATVSVLPRLGKKYALAPGVPSGLEPSVAGQRENLRALLGLYLSEDSRDQTGVAANRRRI